MAWYDNVGSWFGGDSGSGGSTDWWSDIGEGWLGGDNSGGSDGFGWTDWAQDIYDDYTSGNGDSGSGFWSDLIGGFLGGDGDSGNSGNIWGKMLAGGVGSAAQSLIDEKTVREQGKQQRQTYSFQAELADFYNQKDKARKRAALDTYGQFSLLDRWAPNTVSTPGIDVPTKPQA